MYFGMSVSKFILNACSSYCDTSYTVHEEGFSLACMYTRYVLLLIVLPQSMVSMSIISIMLALATVTSTALLDSFNNYEK